MSGFEYFDPSFDPSKETITSLSSILSRHQVPLPNSRQKKQFYIKLFYSDLLPKKEQIMKEIENVVPSREGITIVKPKSKIPVSKSPADLGHFVKKEDLDSDHTIGQSQESSPSSSPDSSPSKATEKRKLDLLTPLRPSLLKKVKTTPEFKFVESHLKFKKPLTPLQVRKQRVLDQMEHDESVTAPKANRFMILPVLPGVRSKIPSEGSVKEMAGKFEAIAKTQDSSRSATFKNTRNEQTIKVTNECVSSVLSSNEEEQEENQMEDWDAPFDQHTLPLRQSKKANSGIWLVILAVFISLFWFFARQQVYDFLESVVIALNSRFPAHYAIVKKYTFVVHQKFDSFVTVVLEKLSESEIRTKFVETQLGEKVMGGWETLKQKSQTIDYAHTATMIKQNKVFKEITISLTKVMFFFKAMFIHSIYTTYSFDYAGLFKQAIQSIKNVDIKKVSERARETAKEFSNVRLSSSIKKEQLTIKAEKLIMKIREVCNQKVELTLGTILASTGVIFIASALYFIYQ